MSTIGTSGGCKNCKRESELNDPPYVHIDYLATDPNKFSIDGGEFLTMVYLNLDGDIAEHCKNAIADKLDAAIVDIITKSVPKGKCYDLKFSSIKITAHCTCNDDDINQGKGPPKADVTVEIGNISSREVPCDPFVPPPDVPPNVA